MGIKTEIGGNVDAKLPGRRDTFKYSVVHSTCIVLLGHICLNIRSKGLNCKLMRVSFSDNSRAERT